MDKRRFNITLESLKADALRTIKLSSPVRTGNLRNSIMVRDLPNGGFEIYIDTNLAPYAEATIEEWIHDHWHGRANPNEGWSEEASREFIRRTKARMQGKLTHKGVLKDRGDQ